jgi:hypothetical protein
MKNRWSHLVPAMAALGAALLFSIGASAATGSFTDPAGDGNGAPDVTGVSMSSAADGTVQLTATVPGLALIDGAKEPEVDVYFDTDKNTSTGSSSGSEFDLYYWRTANDSGWDLDKWNGKDWAEAPASQTLVFSRSGDALTWRFSSKTDIATSGFNFHVVSAIYDANENVTATDAAPDDGIWTFDVASAVIAPAIGKPQMVPAHPTHGKLFSISFPVTRTDTGQPLQGGSLKVTATVGGKTVPKNASLANATANIAIQVPARGKGKTLVVKVTVTANGHSASRNVSLAIR